ncbi:MAG: RagB/SusD family nutrient uptake outer membrane protein [Odoribacteraceae bacterium]|jgi:hypothetical protein|nr:RagB/SusD family nutrient uptake outer membrane protein [Odoribacteraceae bacterium]
MKQILYSILLALGTAACSDMLDVVPENAVRYTNFFETEKDLGQANAELYARLREIYFTYMRPNPHDLMGLRYDAQNTYMSPDELKALVPQAFKEQGGISWSYHYATIFQANLILDNIYRAEGVPGDRIEFYLGHAYFVKAMVYYEIARGWGDAPIPSTSRAIEVLERRPAAEVLDTARGYAERAFNLLRPYNEQVDHRGEPTYKYFGHKAAAAALLAAIHAWRAGRFNDMEAYKETDRYCSLILEGKLGEFRLEDDPEGVCVNKGAGGYLTGESVFELTTNPLDFNSGFTTAHFHAGIGFHMGDTYSYGGWPFNPLGSEEENGYYNYYLVTNATVKEIWKAGDKRRQAYFYEFDTYAPADGDAGYAYPYFWREPVMDPTYEEMVNMQGNRIFWRLADLYLLRAEARCRAGLPGAEADLNTVRDRADAARYPSVDDTGGLQMAIFREREKELFFDGERYYDIVRNGYYRLPGMISPAFEQLTEADVQGGALYLPVSDEAFLDNTKMRRNPYWLSKW